MANINYLKYNEKEQMPITISVIIPTFNRVNLLMRSIQSVLDQTYRDFEIIVVDDASTDSTFDIVNSIEDNRIVFIKHDINRGVSATRNTGISSARGKYVCFLDDDDSWLPNKLEKQIELFEKSADSVGMLYCGCRINYVNQNKPKIDVYPQHRGHITSHLLSSNFIMTHTVMVRKKILDMTHGFDEKMKNCEDWDMWLSISKLCDVDFVNDILAICNIYPYVNGTNRIKYNMCGKLEGRKLLIEKWISDLSNNSNALNMQYTNLAKHYFLNEDFKMARVYIKKALRLNLIQIKSLTLFIFGYISPKYCSKILQNKFYNK